MLQFARLPCWVWVISLNEKRRRECGYSFFSAASSNTSPKLFNAWSIALCAEKILPHLDPSGFLLFTNLTHFCVSNVCLRRGIQVSASPRGAMCVCALDSKNKAPAASNGAGLHSQPCLTPLCLFFSGF